MSVTAWTLGGTGASGGTGVAWINPTFPLTDGTDDALSTIVSQNTAELRITNFNFSSLVPDGAIIDGIEVRTKVYHTNGTSDILDEAIKLFSGGAVVGSNKAIATEWPVFTGGSASVTTRDYGGSTDLWGLSGTIDRAYIISSGFGVSIQAKETAGTSNAARVQAVWIRVHYHVVHTLSDGITNPSQSADGSGYVNRFADGNPSLALVEISASIGIIPMDSDSNAIGECSLPAFFCDGLVDYVPLEDEVSVVVADPGASQLLKAFLQAEPSIGGKLRPYRFSASVTKPSVFLEREPYNVKYPCIVLKPHGGSPQPGTRSSRAFTEYIEVEIRFNINTSSGVLKHLGDTLWKLLDRHIELVQGGKYWFNSERPELSQDTNSLVCTLDLKVNYMENN